MKVTENITLLNIDCMEYMKDIPDKYFDLAVVDPPYGIKRDSQRLTICKNKKHNRKEYKEKGWDNEAASESYFKLLFRKSKDQIIWGANYFTPFLPPSMGWLFWDKGQNLSMSDGELAYTSFDKALRRKVINRSEIGCNGGFIHPTQKPVALYNWIFDKYATPDFKVLDTHLGSGSSAIAAHKFGISEFVGCELDKEYYDASIKRFKEQTAQLTVAI